MSEKLTTVAQADAVESVVIGGDLSKLTAEQRVTYYQRVCQSLGLNPLTKPFSYIVLNGKLTLYANRDAADQLRRRDAVSVAITARETMGDVYVVTARATLPDGRQDESTGAVFVGKATGEALANAMMKAETKAKRRVTLSICGLGWLDETEVADVPDAQPARIAGDGDDTDAPTSARLAPVAPTGNNGWWATLVKLAAPLGYSNHMHIINALVAEHWDQSAMDYAHRGDILECLRLRHAKARQEAIQEALQPEAVSA